LEDKILTCKECSNQFVFSGKEQLFFAEKGFVNQPQRCRECRQARRVQTGAETGALRTTSRPAHAAVCAACAVETTVPFRPRGDRPVYCRSCFSAKVPVGA
jgi:CxxC-x17-CxxC domain-containing protein